MSLLLVATGLPPSIHAASAMTQSGSMLPAPIGAFAFPLPVAAVTSAQLARPHHDYPAIDIAVPLGTPVAAPVDGVVVSISTTTTTWYEPRGERCTAGECSKCGVGARIRSWSGWEWSICHLSRSSLTVGMSVVAGQQVGESGSTGHSSGPHLHYGLRNPAGVSVCPQPLLQALHDGLTPPPLESLASTGCIS